jgi:hypothetical protein
LRVARVPPRGPFESFIALMTVNETEVKVGNAVGMIPCASSHMQSIWKESECAWSKVHGLKRLKQAHGSPCL